MYRVVFSGILVKRYVPVLLLTFSAFRQFGQAV